RDYLEIYKNFLLERTLIMSKDYLDIVHDAVEDIKLGEERNFLNEQDNNKMNNENINANNNLTYNYIKLGVENSSFFSTITSGIANIWKVMMMWTKPFAGLVILILFIAFIILIFFGEDDTSPENSGGVGTGSLVGPSNFNFFSQNMQGGKTNNNTDIISVLQRLPQNIYSFFDKLSAAYTKFSNYVNSSRDFMNSLSDTTPIITNRREQEGNNSKGLYDNIYTFDYQYIDTINKSTGISTCSSSTIDAPNESISTKSNYVYNIKRPKKNSQSKISEYYDISHEYMFYKDGTNNDEYIYAPQCGSNNYVDDDCTIKTKDCGDERKEDTSDYKNIII
ncbi:MAG: hypothetical protein EBU84_17660, partial [Actinobacteria bacterium]|nr:hypothetical protein [Actinomycetota bacterium]